MNETTHDGGGGGVATSLSLWERRRIVVHVIQVRRLRGRLVDTTAPMPITGLCVVGDRYCFLSVMVLMMG